MATGLFIVSGNNETLENENLWYNQELVTVLFEWVQSVGCNAGNVIGRLANESTLVVYMLWPICGLLSFSFIALLLLDLIVVTNWIVAMIHRLAAFSHASSKIMMVFFGAVVKKSLNWTMSFSKFSISLVLVEIFSIESFNLGSFVVENAFDWLQAALNTMEKLIANGTIYGKIFTNYAFDIATVKCRELFSTLCEWAIATTSTLISSLDTCRHMIFFLASNVFEIKESLVFAWENAALFHRGNTFFRQLGNELEPYYDLILSIICVVCCLFSLRSIAQLIGNYFAQQNPGKEVMNTWMEEVKVQLQTDHAIKNAIVETPERMSFLEPGKQKLETMTPFLTPGVANELEPLAEEAHQASTRKTPPPSPSVSCSTDNGGQTEVIDLTASTAKKPQADLYPSTTEETETSTVQKISNPVKSVSPKTLLFENSIKTVASVTSRAQNAPPKRRVMTRNALKISSATTIAENLKPGLGYSSVAANSLSLSTSAASPIDIPASVIPRKKKIGVTLETSTGSVPLRQTDVNILNSSSAANRKRISNASQ
jgi:hypothetical protein